MLIFLDIDGVMIPAKSWKVPENLDDGFPMFSEKAIEALRQLISRDTKVILSTSHRNRFTIDIWKKIFERRGLIIENLSRLEPNENLAKHRRDEILGWFNNHNVRDNFVIIDDDKTLNSLPEYLKRNLILTSSTVGLTAEHLAQIQMT
jgi:hydroxymethylpyrimidine pyrophosphatase-like HAD family hydrolase